MLCEVSEDGFEDCNSYSAQKKKFHKKLNVINKNILCICVSVEVCVC